MFHQSFSLAGKKLINADICSEEDAFDQIPFVLPIKKNALNIFGMIFNMTKEAVNRQKQKQKAYSYKCLFSIISAS